MILHVLTSSATCMCTTDNCFISDSFRLYPVTFATSRLLNEDIEVFGYHLPKGVRN